MARQHADNPGRKNSHWVRKLLLVGGVLLLARSQNRVLRGAGRLGGAFLAPRLVHVLGRR